MSGRIRRILMFKAPIEGAVKTRLAQSIGAKKALEVYRSLGRRQFQAASDAEDLEVRFAPDDAKPLMLEWLGEGACLVPQGAGDLGERMGRAVKQAFEEPDIEGVLLIGADCPSLDSAALAEAESVLRKTEIVVGPASDGGYYLLGLRQENASLFEDIPWGSEDVLEITLDRCRKVGAKAALLEQREDVDDISSLQRQRASLDPYLGRRLFG